MFVYLLPGSSVNNRIVFCSCGQYIECGNGLEEGLALIHFKYVHPDKQPQIKIARQFSLIGA